LAGDERRLGGHQPVKLAFLGPNFGGVDIKVANWIDA